MLSSSLFERLNGGGGTNRLGIQRAMGPRVFAVIVDSRSTCTQSE